MDKPVIPETLYHYCSLETFKNIFESKSIWLSDIQKSNDSKELLWAKNRSVPFIYRAWLNYLEAQKELNGLENVKKEDFNEFSEAKSILENEDLMKCWAFCLSEKRDDLGQWRGYANDGRGVCIGFRSEYFRAVTAGIPTFNEVDSLTFSKVKYGEDDIEKALVEIINPESVPSELASHEIIRKIKHAVVCACWFAPFFKNSSFRDEEEWRLAYITTTSDIQNNSIPGLAKFENPLKVLGDFRKFGYTVKNNDLISHIELGIPVLNNFVDEIILGPKCKVTEYEMQLFLSSIGMMKDDGGNRIKISISGASYQ